MHSNKFPREKSFEYLFFLQNQDYLYEYEDDSNLLSTFSVDLFADEEVREALHLNGDVKRIQKIK
jgi:hypothetical protein